MGQEQQAAGGKLWAFLTDLPSSEHSDGTEGNLVTKEGEKGDAKISLANGSSYRIGVVQQREKILVQGRKV